jgi:hypothetical protein
MCDAGDGEYTHTLDYRLIRSRRETSCAACRATIPRGQLHRMWKQRYEHLFKIDRRCLRCEAIANAMAERGCQVYFDLYSSWEGERIEDVTDLVPDTEPVCELVFATQEELEIRLEGGRGYEAN